MARMEETSVTPNRRWDGETVAIFASGPSMNRDDAEYCRGKARTIAINTTFQLALWADVLYGCDLEWWNSVSGAPDFTGEKWTVNRKAADKWKLNFIQGRGGNGLSLEDGMIHHGSNSGFQAMNLAVLWGAKKIVMLGFDMKPSADGLRHWHGEHPQGVRRRSDYQVFAKFFELAAPQFKEIGVKVINATRDTALSCFETATLESVI